MSRPTEQWEKDHVKLTADAQASGITSSPRNTTERARGGERGRERAPENYVSHKAPHVAPLTVAQVTARWQHLDGPNENKVSVRSQCLAAGCGNTQESSRPAKLFFSLFSRTNFLNAKFPPARQSPRVGLLLKGHTQVKSVGTHFSAQPDHLALSDLHIG